MQSNLANHQIQIKEKAMNKKSNDSKKTDLLFYHQKITKYKEQLKKIKVWPNNSNQKNLNLEE